MANTAAPKKLTPAMQQYQDIKAQYPGALLFFRMGDFYELFFDDAITASRALNLTLTKRGKGGLNEIPMCGVPHHATENYLGKLVQQGFRVAVCDQLEDPKQAKGVVKRGVTRVLSPGAILDQHLLPADNANYLAALVADGGSVGLAWADVSTGIFRVWQGSPLEAQDLAHSLPVAEWLMPDTLLKPAWLDGTHVTELPSYLADPHEANGLICRHFQVQRLDGFGLEEADLRVRSAGMLLRRILDNQLDHAPQLLPPVPLRLEDGVQVDAFTLRNLEIFEPLQGRDKKSTLFATVNFTSTSMGARELRQRLAAPLKDRDAVNLRLDQTGFLLDQAGVSTNLLDTLKRCGDLERLVTRLLVGRLTPPEALVLGESARCAEEARAALAGGVGEELFPWTIGEDLRAFAAGVQDALLEDPPNHLRNGGVIADGVSEELDRLRTLKKDASGLLNEVEIRERERTGISNMRIKYNKVFGYYLEVTKSNLHLVPEDYQRKQTLTNAERFITEELKVLEQDILSAEEKILTLEQDLYQGCLETWASWAEPLRQAGAWLANLDVALSGAELSRRRRYSRPAFTDGELNLKQARHPVVEALSADPFVANDCTMDEKRRILLLTGPNMGGKSTYLRQVALCLILAQAGLYVPAKEARLPLCDKVFSRVGASDDLARGLSTFMMEMVETAHILHQATDRSFLILDEVGRGTATHDGLALAWAILEDLAISESRKPLTLFATHYHELTGLPAHLPTLANLSLAVREQGDQVRFLHQIKEGPSDRSYGIHVARLAGVPGSVVDRAKDILDAMEEASEDTQERLEQMFHQDQPYQPRLLGPAGVAHGAPRAEPKGQEETAGHPLQEKLAEEVRALDPDSLTPRQALEALYRLQALLDKNHDPD